MTETPEEFYERAVSVADEERRLALPPVEEWDTFPFEGDIKTRALQPPTEIDRPRVGEDQTECWRCRNPESDAIWSDDDWILGSLGRPSGLPIVVILFPRSHYDIDDLPEDLASQLGPMLIRVESAARSVGNIGRIHVCRWGDGSAHLHWWFMGRPARIPQLVGSFAAIWDDIVPPLPRSQWEENLSLVAAAMASDGGTDHTT